MTRIEDGGGTNGDMTVSSKQRGDVSAQISKRIFYVSRDDGRSFVWTSAFDTSGTDVEVLYIKNTSTTRRLFIDSSQYSSAVAQLFSVFKHTGTATGTNITGEVLNFKSPNPIAESASLGNAAITAGTIGNNLANLRCVAGGEGNRNWNGEIILGEGDSVIVTASTSGVMEFSVTGFFE